MRIVRGLFLAALLVTGSLGAVIDRAAADGLEGGTAGAIRTVIESQMAAFRIDDGPGAFAFASPGIQSIFQNPDNFMRMVRTGYQPVYRPQSVEFLDLVNGQLGPVQRVRVVGPDGHAWIAHYSMEQQPDGSWRIDGCTLTDAPDIGV